MTDEISVQEIDNLVLGKQILGIEFKEYINKGSFGFIYRCEIT